MRLAFFFMFTQKSGEIPTNKDSLFYPGRTVYLGLGMIVVLALYIGNIDVIGAV